MLFLATILGLPETWAAGAARCRAADVPSAVLAAAPLVKVAPRGAESSADLQRADRLAGGLIMRICHQARSPSPRPDEKPPRGRRTRGGDPT